MPLGYKDVAQIPFLHLSYLSGGVYEYEENETWPPLHAHGELTDVFLVRKILVPRRLSSCKRVCTSKCRNYVSRSVDMQKFRKRNAFFVYESVLPCRFLARHRSTCRREAQRDLGCSFLHVSGDTTGTASGSSTGSQHRSSAYRPTLVSSTPPPMARPADERSHKTQQSSVIGPPTFDVPLYPLQVGATQALEQRRGRGANILPVD